MSVTTPLYEVGTVQKYDLFNTRVHTLLKVRVRRTVLVRVPMPSCDHERKQNHLFSSIEYELCILWTRTLAKNFLQ